MNNNDKSANRWIHRLFKQSNVLSATPESTIYFARCYPADSSLQGRSPFSTLFSESNNKPSEAENHQRVFGQKSPLLTDCSDSPEAVQICRSNRLPVPNEAVLSAQYTVLNCYDETPDVKTFRLGRLDGQSVDYLSGQYMTLTMAISGQEFKRSYSLASSPARAKIIDLTVKRAPNGGIVSNWLNDHLNIGDTLNLKGPFGRFSCVTHATEKMLFLAAGSGIAPIMSMLRWLVDTEARMDVSLLLSFRSPADIIYRDELQLIAARHQNIKLAITLTAETIDYSQWLGLTGRINEKMIANLVPDLPERTVYLCGPDSFMAMCKKSLLKLNLPSSKLFCESYTVNSPIIKPQNSCLNQPLRHETGNYQVKFAKSGKTIDSDGRVTLLELAERIGVLIGHECRSGQCGECMTKCLKGKVDMMDQAEIDEVDSKKGWIYACCTYPASNVELDV